MRGPNFNMEAAPGIVSDPLGENSDSSQLLRKLRSKNADLWRHHDIPFPRLQHPFVSTPARIPGGRDLGSAINRCNCLTYTT